MFSMTDFIDLKKHQAIKIDNSFIVKQASTLASGATLAIMSPNVDWQEIDKVVGTRKQPRNSPMGIVFTKPTQKQTLLETVWEDSNDSDQADGDMTLFTETDGNTLEFERLSPTEIRKRFPRWHPYHHENKDYLK